MSHALSLCFDDIKFLFPLPSLSLLKSEKNIFTDTLNEGILINCLRFLFHVFTSRKLTKSFRFKSSIVIKSALLRQLDEQIETTSVMKKYILGRQHTGDYIHQNESISGKLIIKGL